MHFAGVNVQRAMLVAQLLERLGNFILQLELRLQFRRRGHFWRSRRRAFQPRSDRAVSELRLIANDGPIHVARTDRAAGSRSRTQSPPPACPRFRAETTRPSKALPATSKNCRCRYKRWSSPWPRADRSGESLRDKRIHIGDAHHHLDAAIGQAFGDFDLVEIARSIVIDRRPKQPAQIAHLIGRRQLWRMRADIRQLLPRRGRKIRLETLRQHDLPRHCLKIERRRPRIVHYAPLSRNISFKRLT